jgi:hypothetical protein
MMNFLFPICPPPRCVAQLVVHLSSADNRPSTDDNDPRGRAKRSEKDVDIMDFLGLSQFLWPGPLYVHKVDGYDIGSAEEGAAMDMVEAELSDATVRGRMRMLRFADPRRYSMWFARAWAWRSAETLILGETSCDFFAFTRPDLLWLLPAPTVEFFKHFVQERDSDVWVHDSYYSNVPDTFALFASQHAANLYFSLPSLVEPGVACLGGPNFNQILVRDRLSQIGIFPNQDDWCSTVGRGWSEHIIKQKLKSNGLVVRHFPAAPVILRPPMRPACLPIHPRFQIGSTTRHRNYAPFIACLGAQADLGAAGSTNVSAILNRPRPYQLQLRGGDRRNPTTCLSLWWRHPL